jgi:hypothetical protein
MPDIQHREPIVIAAGDSLIFRRRLPEFPAAAGWSLTYSLFASNGQATDVSIDSTPVTGTVYDYLMTENNFAATLPAGIYVLVGYAENNNGEKHQIYRANLTLTENLSAGKPVKNLLWFEQQMVNDLQESLRRSVRNELQETDVQRVRILRKRTVEIRTELAFWEERLHHRQQMEQMRNTGRNPNSIGMLLGGGW